MSALLVPVLLSTAGALVLGLWLAYLFATRMGAPGSERLLLWFLALIPWVVLASQRWPPGIPAAGIFAGGLLVAIITALDYRNLRGRCDAARSLGASEWRIFWRVFLPMRSDRAVFAAMAAFVRLLIEHSLTTG